MSETKPETPGEKETQDAINAVLSQIDLEKISQNDVFHDVMRTLQETSFKFVLAAKLMEHIFVRDGVFKKVENADESAQN